MAAPFREHPLAAIRGDLAPPKANRARLSSQNRKYSLPGQFDASRVIPPCTGGELPVKLLAPERGVAHLFGWNLPPQIQANPAKVERQVPLADTDSQF